MALLVWKQSSCVREQGFRDFSCLLPVEENRGQPADLARQNTHASNVMDFEVE